MNKSKIKYIIWAFVSIILAYAPFTYILDRFRNPWTYVIGVAIGIYFIPIFIIRLVKGSNLERIISLIYILLLGIGFLFAEGLSSMTAPATLINHYLNFAVIGGIGGIIYLFFHYSLMFYRARHSVLKV